MSIGRTDFERGSYTEIIRSLQLMASSLPASTTIYPGHGPQTTMADEVCCNPYFR